MLLDHSVVWMGLFGTSVPDGFLPGLAGGIIATGIGFVAAISGIKDVSDWWRLQTTESVPIDESVATEGMVQIRGTVRPLPSSDVFISPIQNEECVAYEYNLTRQVQGTGDPSIDSGIEYGPFIIADRKTKIYVEPTEESLSLDREISTVAGSEELLKRVEKEKTDVEPPAAGNESRLPKGPIELVESSISVGTKITIVGKVTATPERVAVDVDGAMTPETGRLVVADDEPRTAALRTGARGAFLLVVGGTLILMGLGVLVANTANLAL